MLFEELKSLGLDLVLKLVKVAIRVSSKRLQVL